MLRSFDLGQHALLRLMRLLERPTRHLFFTGKGGVGKTSTSCAAAVALADRGKRVLLVSTDPASNLDEVFGTPLGDKPTEIPGVDRLQAMNVDPEAAAAAYRERVVGPYRNLLPHDAVASIEEQLAGACTVEIAAFDEFAKLIGNRDATRDFDHIVFDTAPTGHTLRLLALPAAWSGFIGKSAAGTSCLGPLQGLVAQREIYATAVATLCDAATTTMVLVTRPEAAAMKEAERTSAELASAGVRNQLLLVNGVFQARATDDPVAASLQRIGREAVAAMPARIGALERVSVALKPRQLIGIESLRRLFKDANAEAGAPAASSGATVSTPPPLDALIDALEKKGAGVVLTMGKGGVGKTTIAARIASVLAARGHRVHLTTTDPAAHVLEAALGEGIGTLSIGRIDPRVEVERYRAEVMATTGAKLDANGRALLEEDLASPCTEEVAVFQAFARVVAEAEERFVVIDTAPTGHTILLLDAAQAYHREVMRQSRNVSDSVRNLLPRLRDPAFTSIVLCTLAEATPVHEAAALQSDLRRAGIEPYAWVVNQSFAPLAVRDPLLVARRTQEAAYIDEVANGLASRVFIVSWDERLAEAGIAREHVEAA